MRAVVQRVREASVSVGKQCCGQIGRGLLVLLGVASHDTAQDAEYLCSKIITLRIFEDEEGKMNRSLIDMGGQLLVVSQFTLLADCRKGRRPSFTDAAPPAKAEDLYNHFVEIARGLHVHVQTGCFGAMMAVALVNDGPVTLIIDSKAR